MVWNRVKEHPILRSSSILASTELASFQFGLTRVLKAFTMADSVTEENRALKMVCKRRGGRWGEQQFCLGPCKRLHKHHPTPA